MKLHILWIKQEAGEIVVYANGLNGILRMRMPEFLYPVVILRCGQATGTILDSLVGKLMLASVFIQPKRWHTAMGLTTTRKGRLRP